jgi:hypothetical protein
MRVEFARKNANAPQKEIPAAHRAKDFALQLLEPS